MAHLQLTELIPADRLEVFDYVTHPLNLPELLKPMIEVEVLSPDIELKRGHEIHFNMSRYHLSQSVRFQVEDILKGSRLTYRQSEGIFASWVHTMKFEDHAEKMTLITDIVDYHVPLGLFGYVFDDLLLKADMTRILAHRLNRVKEHFESSTR